MPPLENPSRYIALAFALSDADLDTAIQELDRYFGRTLYRVAWRLLTTERARRREPGSPPPRDVRMTRAIAEDLPPRVQALLWRHRRQAPIP